MKFKDGMLQDILASMQNKEEFHVLHWTGSFEKYLEQVLTDPSVAANARRRICRMILDAGFEEYVDAGKKMKHFKFFTDENIAGPDTLFGLDAVLMKLVNFLDGAARGYGLDRRLLLLRGPVGSAKSTIARRIKRGLEAYSRTERGALYSFSWHLENLDREHLLNLIPQASEAERSVAENMIGQMLRDKAFACQFNEEPLMLVPKNAREEFVRNLNQLILERGYEPSYPFEKMPIQLNPEADLCPQCRLIMDQLLRLYRGNWNEVVRNHIQVRRVLISEIDRIGIGTFQPKDEKNQDSTELTGDVGLRRMTLYDSEFDPRAFNYRSGEFVIANRGVFEVPEILKLDEKFLYDFLFATQEQTIKPKNQPQAFVDEFIIGHTNEPEYQRVMNNPYMEALQNRTIVLDVPYVTRVSQETKIYQRDFHQGRLDNLHIAPHVFEIVGLWAVMTRLAEVEDVTILKKARLYDGRDIPGFNDEAVREMRKDGIEIREGLSGISPRYIQDKFSTAIIKCEGNCLSPFRVLRELQEGLRPETFGKKVSETELDKYAALIEEAREELRSLIEADFKGAVQGDTSGAQIMFVRYIENIKAYTQGEKIRDRLTRELRDPDANFMKRIENKMSIAPNAQDNFRRELMNVIGSYAVEGKKFTYGSDDRLKDAIDQLIFEDLRDSGQLAFAAVYTDVVDKETQKKISVVIKNLVDKFGYCSECAQQAFEFIASSMNRG